MADIATIGVLHERVVRESRDVSAQLEFALESRIAIEQAKGIVAEHNHISVDLAFDLIRRYTRDQNQLLSETARKIIEGTLRPEQLPRGSPHLLNCRQPGSGLASVLEEGSERGGVDDPTAHRRVVRREADHLGGFGGAHDGNVMWMPWATECSNPNRP